MSSLLDMAEEIGMRQGIERGGDHDADGYDADGVGVMQGRELTESNPHMIEGGSEATFSREKAAPADASGRKMASKIQGKRPQIFDLAL